MTYRSTADAQQRAVAAAATVRQVGQCAVGAMLVAAGRVHHIVDAAVR